MASSERPHDEIWDVLSECFGEVRTKSERGRRNAAVRELRDAKATPEEIRVAYHWCRGRFTTFTEMAIVNHLSRALHEQRESALVRELWNQGRGIEI